MLNTRRKVMKSISLLMFLVLSFQGGEARIPNDLLTQKLWKRNENGYVVEEDYGSSLSRRIIRSSDNKKIEQATKKLILDDDEDVDEEEGEITGLDYNNNNKKNGNGSLPQQSGQNNPKSFEEDEESEIGSQTLEDLDELERFYENTKNNIMRTHRSRILETPNTNRVQAQKDPGNKLGNGKQT